MKKVWVHLLANPACSKSDVEKKVASYAETIWFHAFKFKILGKNNPSYHHWMKEFANIANIILRLKSNAVTFDWDFYDTELWEGNNATYHGSYLDFIKKIKAKYHVKVNIPEQKAFEFTTKFMNKFCQLLADKRQVREKVTNFEIIELVNRLDNSPTKEREDDK